MPDLTGLELLAEARQLGFAAPVVLYTACGSKALEAAARLLGAAEFKETLLDLDSLLQLVRRHLSSAPGVSSHHDLAASVGPATRRWVQTVLAVTRARDDVPTLADWAKLGNSIATLKKICKVCHMRAGDSLDFARALRIVVQYSSRTCDWYNVLDIREPATMLAFLSRAGLSAGQPLPRIRDFLTNQRFVTSETLLHALQETVCSP
jgi:hypothetical protein